MLPVFGFSGKARHGKDTCATMLQQYAASRGVNLITLPMALPLKARVYGALPEATLAEVFVTKPPAVRHAQQQEGTERGRDVFGEDFWVRHAEAYRGHLTDTAPFIHGIIVPDVRFENELTWVRRHGYAILVTSDRPTLTGDAATHRSETALDHLPLTEWDGVIENDLTRSLPELQAVVCSHFRHFIEPR